MSEIIIGIDLGTTNTCAAVYLNNNIKILHNKEGGRLTPSFIFVTEKESVIVGQYAQKMAEAKPEYGISEIKRLIGRRYDDPYVQNNMKYFPFTLTNNNNEPLISITRKNEKFTKNPVDLCSTILKKVKEDAEDKVGTNINKAVITVPAYFNVSQREATLEAAKKAGLTVLKLLNEPTAAALTYYFSSDENGSYALVYDLGGGTFDVAILKRDSNNIDIIGVGGEAHLGGHDFDNLIIDYVCDYLIKNHNFNPKQDHRAMRRLQRECEEAKKTLSVSEETTIVLNGFVKSCSTLELELIRQKFEEMTHHLFKKTINIVENCLKSCKLTKGDIKEVILSGGSTRIPRIQALISNFFLGKNLNKMVNPDECVAEGAALQAAMFSSNPKQKITTFCIKDVTPLSLGIADFVDIMSVIIKRNTQIPVSQTLAQATVINMQNAMKLDIYEGERTSAKKNRHLGSVVIENITPAPPRQCEVICRMTIDENGILKFRAKEKLRDNFKDLTINYTRGFRSDKEVKNALRDAEENAAEDQHFLQFAYLKDYVLNYCEQVKYNLEKENLSVSYQEIYELCKSVEQKAKEMNLENENQLKELRTKIDEKFHPVVEKHNFKIIQSSHVI